MFFLEKMFFTIDIALYIMTILTFIYMLIARSYYEKREKEFLKDEEGESNLDDEKKTTLNYLSELFKKIPTTVFLAFLICTIIFTILTIIIK